jgi:membrane-associated phospholipid phosphatase
MRLRSFISFFALLSLPVAAYAQKTDTLVKKLDSMRKEETKPDKPIIDVDKDEYTSQTNITPKAYLILLGTDLKQEVTSPFHATKKTWIKVGEFVALEGAMFFADKPIQKATTEFMARNTGLRTTSEYITNFGGAWEGYILAAFGAYGFIFKSNKVKTTTLLATQAYITAGAMSYVVKYLTGRQRPNYYDPAHPAEPDNTVFRGPSIFNGNHPASGFGSSFPSGHTTAAFCAATVFAYEYKDQIVIPVIAYSIAGLVGVSRITENAHWTTDVLAGFALGYITGKQVVNNYHRYARLRSGKQPKVSVLFNLQYEQGIFMPGVVCKF